MRNGFLTITRILSTATLLLAIPAAAEVFYDEAPVLDAQPVYQARQVPVQVQECGYEKPAAPAFVDAALLGDARNVDPGTDLFGALQRDVQLREPPAEVYRCRQVTRTEQRQELAGYQVRYEYGGQVYERRVAEHPGESIRVSVQLSTSRSNVTRWR